MFSVDAAAVRAGQRRALAKAITLVESSLPAHREAARALLEELLPASGNSIRIGISGVPGVGKSTFIEAFGQLLVARGHRLAVLAVDPSSPVAGGSIMGDKTRMEALSRDERVFIRPSPSGGTLGGVAQKTRESMLLCEAAGFDVVFVETVGVGQSEYQVAGMVDFFMLLMLPGGGDELQGIKKGIMELAHALVINKADGDAARLAAIAQSQYQSALSLLHSDTHWQPEVRRCSSLEKKGLEDVWEMIERFVSSSRASGDFERQRRRQSRVWMQQLVQRMLLDRLESDPAVGAALPDLERAVEEQLLTPLTAARRVLALLDGEAAPREASA
ncbi:MAG: methylmalonyl Co-A mutase-associated GTPase MeaB [Halieaceae bacterium]|nr:methylmalonyl Co-A mutase-associated GTPase MeaB [Halieaceae bacterium]